MTGATNGQCDQHAERQVQAQADLQIGQSLPCCFLQIECEGGWGITLPHARHPRQAWRQLEGAACKMWMGRPPLALPGCITAGPPAV